MSKFENVNIVKEANIYYDGKVTSRTVEFNDGSVKSLGIMLEGAYTFNTADEELMEIYSGSFDLKIAGSEKFVAMNGPCSFGVKANSSFDIKVKSVTDYCCSYIK
jgi:uncharacterized protein YaiE (UPF0345 family)